MPTYLSPGVYVEEIPSAVQAISGVGTSTAGFIGIVPDSVNIPGPNPAHDPTKPDSDANKPFLEAAFATAAAGEPLLCTSFTEYTKAFGGFSENAGQQLLTHGVYGVFNNRGTPCRGVRRAGGTGIDT